MHNIGPSAIFFPRKVRYQTSFAVTRSANYARYKLLCGADTASILPVNSSTEKRWIGAGFPSLHLYQLFFGRFRKLKMGVMPALFRAQFTGNIGPVSVPLSNLYPCILWEQCDFSNRECPNPRFITIVYAFIWRRVSNWEQKQRDLFFRFSEEYAELTTTDRLHARLIFVTVVRDPCLPDSRIQYTKKHSLKWICVNAKLAQGGKSALPPSHNHSEIEETSLIAISGDCENYRLYLVQLLATSLRVFELTSWMLSCMKIWSEL